MAFDARDSITLIKEYLEGVGAIDSAHIGLAIQEPGDRLSAYVYTSGNRIVATTLGKPIEVLILITRFYHRYLNEDPEEVENILNAVVSLFAEALAGDLDLGSTIRNTDFAGQYGEPLSSTWFNQENLKYRIVEMRIPLIIDDSFSFVQ